MSAFESKSTLDSAAFYPLDRSDGLAVNPVEHRSNIEFTNLSRQHFANVMKFRPWGCSKKKARHDENQDRSPRRPTDRTALDVVGPHLSYSSGRQPVTRDYKKPEPLRRFSADARAR
jgi:hypothetical protein